MLEDLDGNRFNGIYFRQDFTSNTNYFLPGWSNLRQMLAAAGKNLNAQLIFQHSDLLTDPRL